MTDTHAKLTVYGESLQLFAKGSRVDAEQSVEIPSSWFGRRSGSYSVIKRNVNVLGTIDIDYYGHERVEYGKCRWKGCVVILAKVGCSWKAIGKGNQ